MFCCCHTSEEFLKVGQTLKITLYEVTYLYDHDNKMSNLVAPCFSPFYLFTVSVSRI